MEIQTTLIVIALSLSGTVPTACTIFLFLQKKMKKCRKSSTVKLFAMLNFLLAGTNIIIAYSAYAGLLSQPSKTVIADMEMLIVGPWLLTMPSSVMNCLDSGFVKIAKAHLLCFLLAGCYFFLIETLHIII
jgi:hypothetical protein